MKHNLTRYILLWVVPIVCLAARPCGADEFEQIGKLRSPNAVAWGGVRWTTTELNGFKGRPKTASDANTSHFVTVAYDRFVSYYNLTNFAPQWVAYVTDRSSANVAEANARIGTEFDRPRTFSTDKLIADASDLLGLAPTEHFDFSDRVPEGLPIVDLISKNLTAQEARGRASIIERGHLAPNQTMKCWGNKTKGKNAQLESFSLANVVPQMKAHNAPTWSALEAQCLFWAKELGSVCVVVGPVYNNPSQPKHIQDRRTGARLPIVFADALFCVVIGKRAGQPAAIGFIMPQQTVSYSFRTKAVPIDVIEQATGIDFMPLLNEPNPLEQAVDQRWLN